MFKVKSHVDLLVDNHTEADYIGTTETYLEYLSLIDEKNIPFEVQKGKHTSLDPSVSIKGVHADSSATDNNDAQCCHI